MNGFAGPGLQPPSRMVSTTHSPETRSSAQDKAIWAKQADGLASRMTQNLKMSVRKLERSKRAEGRAMDLPQLRPGIYHNNPLEPMPKTQSRTASAFKPPTFQVGARNSGAAGGPLPRNQDTVIPRVERPTPLPQAPGERMGRQV